jgi:plastocyanin
MRPRLPALLFVLSGALGLLGLGRQTVEPGSIRGRVAVPVTPAGGTRPLVGDLGGTARDLTDRRRAVIYVDPAPRPALEELPAGHARIDQRNEEFIPHVLAITVGTTVDFPNDDTKFHNVFSLSHVKTFDLGRYPVGHSKSVVFDKSGIVPISCDIHTHMSAYVLVFNHPYFAVADEDGRYTIPNVPAGSYTLKVWSEVGQADPRAVVVLSGETVECDFRLDRSR